MEGWRNTTGQGVGIMNVIYVSRYLMVDLSDLDDDTLIDWKTAIEEEVDRRCGK